MQIDVSQALTSPMLTDRFTVKRRKEGISQAGRSTSQETPIENVYGTVCASSSNDLERLPEMDVMKRYITVVTKFQLRGVSKSGPDTFKPDIISWRGNEYLVETLDPYGHVGSGFVQAIAGSINIVDEA